MHTFRAVNGYTGKLLGLIQAKSRLAAQRKANKEFTCSCIFVYKVETCNLSYMG